MHNRTLVGLLRLLRRKRRYSSPAALHDLIARRDRRPARFSPPRLRRSPLEVSRDDRGGMPCYTVGPTSRDGQSVDGPLVVYLHGGAYVSEIVLFHWRLVGQMVRGAGATCTVPIYPLAPQSDAASVVPKVADIVAATITAAEPTRPVVLMGDSAGGGLALAVTQELLAQRGPTPDRLVLISPWLDVTLPDPRQAALEDDDPMLAIPGAREAGRLWAADLPTSHRWVSPINGPMTGLPPVTVLTGTRDLVNPDSHRLAESAAASHVSIELHEEPGMTHVYPLLPTPQGRAATRSIVTSLAHVEVDPQRRLGWTRR